MSHKGGESKEQSDQKSGDKERKIVGPLLWETDVKYPTDDPQTGTLVLATSKTWRRPTVYTSRPALYMYIRGLAGVA